MTPAEHVEIRLETTADGLVLIADVDGAPAAAIAYADGEPVGGRADSGLLAVLRAYRWGIRGFAAVWAA